MNGVARRGAVRRLPLRAWIAIALVLGAIAAASAYGWFAQSYPVAITSRSMSHADHNLDGVLDPGERVSLAPVHAREDVVTFLEGRKTGHRVADEYGDALSFTARGERGTNLILHRAIAWVEYDPQTDAYDVPELGLQDVRTFMVPGVGIFNPFSQAYEHHDMEVQLAPDVNGRHSGFLMKGDYNWGFDQDAYGGFDDTGRIHLVQVADVDGRVTSWVEEGRSYAIFWWALGIAATVAIGYALLGRDGRAALVSRASRGRRCGACGGALDASVGFCGRCGESVPQNG